MAYCCDYCDLPVSPDVVDDALEILSGHLENAHGMPDANPVEHVHEC